LGRRLGDRISGAHTHIFADPPYIQHVNSTNKFRINQLTADIIITKKKTAPVPLLPAGFVGYVLRNLQTGDSSIHGVQVAE
jgi:hypothetical protein